MSNTFREDVAIGVAGNIERDLAEKAQDLLNKKEQAKGARGAFRLVQQRLGPLLAKADVMLEEGEITITGSGEVDFVRGVYDLELEPSTTNPGIVSMAPRVQVGGPLADPQFRPVKRTLASSMGRGLLSNARRAAAGTEDERDHITDCQGQNARPI